MTRERIKDFKEIVLPFFTNYLLKKNYENLGKSDAEEFEKDFSEIIELADKALEQQPCEDTISRKALLEEIENGIKAGNYEEGYEEYPHINDMDDIIECIKYADSVQPKPKTGHWIYDGDQIICNRCFKAFGFISLKLTSNYCPNCGAKMDEE